MNCIKIGDTVINLENVTRMTFVENDENTTADDRCRIHFVGVTDPLIFRGSAAREVFDKVENQMFDK